MISCKIKSKASLVLTYFCAYVNFKLNFIRECFLDSKDLS